MINHHRDPAKIKSQNKIKHKIKIKIASNLFTVYVNCILSMLNDLDLMRMSKQCMYCHSDCCFFVVAIT